MKTTSVIILNWNGRKYLEKFLPVLLKYSSDLADIVVADNASTDTSLDYIKKYYPQIKLIVLDKNYGFSEGYNMAMQQVNTEYSILLNSDVEVTPGWLEPLIKMLVSNEKIAVVMPKVRSYCAMNKFEYAGACGGYIDNYGYPFCRGRIINTIEEDTGQYDEPTEIFWVTGACFAVKTRLFKTAGGFDESFFAHQEEIDLCWRLKLMGYKIMVEPSSVIYHVGGGTLSSENPRKLYLNYRNNLAMLYKNLPPSKMKRLVFIRLLLDGMSSIVYLLQGKPQSFMAVFNAHRSFFRMLPDLRVKRKSIRYTSNINNIYRGSIILSYYLGKKTFGTLQDKFR